MTRTLLVTIALICVCFEADAATEAVNKTTNYFSPDKQLRVDVSSSPANGESIVRIYDRRGRLVSTKDFTSDDGQHGYYVSKAQWTPDSQFFVYSLESSGGHSVMSIPVILFYGKTKQSFVLGTLLDEVINFPDFSVSAPDRVKVSLGNRYKVVSLSRLLIEKKQSLKEADVTFSSTDKR